MINDLNIHDMLIALVAAHIFTAKDSENKYNPLFNYNKHIPWFFEGSPWFLVRSASLLCCQG